MSTLEFLTMFLTLAAIVGVGAMILDLALSVFHD